MVHTCVFSIMVLAYIVLLPSVQDPFLVTPEGERFLTGASPFVFDALLVFYLFAIVVLSGLTHRNIEEPGQHHFNRWSERLAAALKASDAMPARSRPAAQLS